MKHIMKTKSNKLKSHDVNKDTVRSVQPIASSLDFYISSVLKEKETKKFDDLLEKERWHRKLNF